MVVVWVTVEVSVGQGDDQLNFDVLNLM